MNTKTKKAEYFYRVLGSEVFEECKEEKQPVPVMLKSESDGENMYFSFESNKWLPFRYEKFDSNDSQFFAEFKKKQENDKFGINMDITGSSVITDEETLSVEFSVQYLSRGKGETAPAIQEESVLFDMKNGTIQHSVNPKNQKHTFFSFSELEDSSLVPPKKAVNAALKNLLTIAEKFTQKKISSIYFATEPNSKDEKKQIESALFEIQALMRLPFAHELYPVICSKELKNLNLQFKFNREDSDVLKKFFGKMKIENCKMTQNAYLKNPMLLVTYIKMKKCGFKDANLFEAVLFEDENAKIIDSIEISILRPFSKFCIKKCGEAAAMSILLKKSDSIENKTNGIAMLMQNFRHIPKELVKDILESGFTDENCLALSAVR